MEVIVARDNLKEALRQVKRNKGAPTGHAWMAPASQGFFGVSASKTDCGRVSGLVARRAAAGPDGLRGLRSDQAGGVALPHDR
jgi:hypothetical protein